MDKNDKIKVYGSENINATDKHNWWNFDYEYIGKDGIYHTLEELQEKYNLGFADKRLWDLIDENYKTVECFTMNRNHPEYKEHIDKYELIGVKFPVEVVKYGVKTVEGFNRENVLPVIYAETCNNMDDVVRIMDQGSEYRHYYRKA